MVIDEPDCCVSCAQQLAPKSCGWWDRTERTVTCTACRPIGTTIPRPSLTSLPPPAPIEYGTGSVDAQQEHERRVAKLRRQPGFFGEKVIGDIGVHIADETPLTTTSRIEEAEDERGLAAFLDREIGHAATVLHNRRVSTTRGTIDHLVVASTGVWVIGVKDYAGKVECRNEGGRQTPESRLFVSHRNQTKLVASTMKQAKAVERALETVGFSGVPIQSCLCLTGADWRFRSKPFWVDGVWIGWPQALIKALRATPILERTAVATLADHLSTQFPSAS